MKNQAPDSISSSVMNKIKNGEVQMKPQLHYTLIGLVSVSAILVTSITSAYLFSIMFFWLRIQTADTMAYGARIKLANSLDSFPSWAFLVAVILLCISIFLAHRYHRIYKYRVSTVAAVLIFCSLLLGLGISFFDIGTSHSPRTKNRPGQYQAK